MTQKSSRACAAATLLTSLLVVVACDLPRDADGTVDRIRNGTMHVGYVADTPWVTDSAQQAGGVEGAIARTLARQLNASIVWHSAPSSTLLESLNQRELDLVLGDLSAKSPWKQQVALTRPFFTDTIEVPGPPNNRQPVHRMQQLVLAVPPGENAWLTRVEQLIYQQRDQIAALARKAGR